jgi:hypothetical protein
VLFNVAAQAGSHINVTTTADEFGIGSACSFREALYAISHAQAYGGCTLGGSLFDSISRAHSKEWAT